MKLCNLKFCKAQNRKFQLLTEGYRYVLYRRLMFQTQEPADVKCGKARALKHGLDRALFVKT